ncbi:MAG: phosphoribosyl-AMP cyclohydrolase [Candidatus Marinimicrobia bacterium]|nr:phosphoribosyl-AMP cyclohydrolase [Candidatus Neomarinimicrobiota bacterium]
MNLDDAKTYVEELNLKLDQSGLLPAIIQDEENGQILMLAYMSPESLAITLTEGQTCFRSRSRQVIWHKGETSGHRQIVKAISLDCDRDTMLIQVEQVGAACHNETRTCFIKSLEFGVKILKSEEGN